MANRSDLVKFVRETAGCTWGAALRTTDAALCWLAGTIANGERVEIRGLGTFYSVERAERKSSLPTTSIIPAHRKVKFKPGRYIMSRLTPPARPKTKTLTQTRSAAAKPSIRPAPPLAQVKKPRPIFSRAEVERLDPNYNPEFVANCKNSLSKMFDISGLDSRQILAATYHAGREFKAGRTWPEIIKAAADAGADGKV